MSFICIYLKFCRPAQINAAVHGVRPLQRHFRPVLGPVAAHTVVGALAETAPLPRPVRQGRNTRRR